MKLPKTIIRFLWILFIVTMEIVPVHAATNQATDPGGGSVALVSSGILTVTSSALQLVKQVYDSAGNCLASSPADVNCNTSATTITVPAGTSLKFLIFIKNTSDIALTDVRFQDLMDDSATGFTYVTPSIKRTANDGTAPADTATLATIFSATNTGTGQTDAVGAPDDFVSITDSNANGKLDKLTVGAVTGQANQTLSFQAHRTFAILFQVTKN